MGKCWKGPISGSAPGHKAIGNIPIGGPNDPPALPCLSTTLGEELSPKLCDGQNESGKSPNSVISGIEIGSDKSAPDGKMPNGEGRKDGSGLRGNWPLKSESDTSIRS